MNNTNDNTSRLLELELQLERAKLLLEEARQQDARLRDTAQNYKEAVDTLTKDLEDALQRIEKLNQGHEDTFQRGFIKGVEYTTRIYRG